MTTKTNSSDILETPEMDTLARLVEEATRATTEAPRRFIEPARGTLDRAKAKRHHLVFGRRGSGKTSLLRKALADLSLSRSPAAFVDLEAFKGHSYPDVLLSILIEMLRALDNWFETAGTNPASKATFWKRLFGGKPTRPPLNREKVAALRETIAHESTSLRELLHSADNAAITEKIAKGHETGESSVLAGEAGASGIKFSGSANSASKATSDHEITEARKRSKTDFLHRHIIDYQQLFENVVAAAGTDAYVFLDDLYHIRRPDQAHVLDYFHRIVKGRSVWLKIGTIRHRTEWYHHGDPPIGVKLGDDADDIDLDITLEKYVLAKRFLLAILDQLIHEAGLRSHGDILADGGVERLVLACGGVARDFLTIFRRAIDVARERGPGARGPKINAEDVNAAAGEHDASKRDELKRDTIEERERLENALNQLQDFCIDRTNNCLLVERDRVSPGASIINELVDLRFLHLVESRTTVRDEPGRLY